MFINKFNGVLSLRNLKNVDIIHTFFINESFLFFFFANQLFAFQTFAPRPRFMIFPPI